MSIFGLSKATWVQTNDPDQLWNLIIFHRRMEKAGGED
jgi:hypothetical protein